MFAFLLSVGILVTVASIVAIGFGIPNNGFDVGNTLIVAGTTGLGAGLILIGLAACVRELRRIGDALPARSGVRSIRAVEPIEPEASATQRGGQHPRVPYPPNLGPDGPVREQRPFEPRVAASEPPPPPEEPPLERPRPNIFAVGRATGEAPLVDEPEPAPVAASRTPAAPIGRMSGQSAEPAYEPKFGPADILARLGVPGRAAAKAEMRPVPGSERVPDRQPAERQPIERQRQPADRPPVERPAEPAPQRPERPRGNVFDAVWPPDGKPPRPAGPDTIARVSQPDIKPELKLEARERAEPPIPAEAREIAPPRTASESRPISILKSGVIDGMAYTLYTDGSIEAQLPQGTMHFASIEELRLHLEQNG
jgi:hypothetical protein